jgi:putative membrane protein
MTGIEMEQAANTQPITSASRSDLFNTELSSRRTGVSFQRTRMSADRTLMSIIRTSLALISFGFTIFHVFEKLRQQKLLTGAAPARNLGVALVSLGILMLIMGIVYHGQFMLGLRHSRQDMAEKGLVHAESSFPVSLTLIVALLLLFIGVSAIVSMVFHVGPFG